MNGLRTHRRGRRYSSAGSGGPVNWKKIVHVLKQII